MLSQSELFPHAASGSESHQSSRLRRQTGGFVTDRRQPAFAGDRLDIEKDFKAQLQAFVPELFRPDNVNFIKEINGEHITSTQLFEYFRVRAPSIASKVFDCCSSFVELLRRLRLRRPPIAESHARGAYPPNDPCSVLISNDDRSRCLFIFSGNS